MPSEPPIVGLCVVATGRYVCFVSPLLDSARLHFLPDCQRRLFLFSDWEPRAGSVNCWYYTPFEPWPRPTLHRYRYMLKAEAELAKCDYIMYCDVDMRFVAPVGREILGDLVAVQHPGFVGKPRRTFTYETRPESRACVRPDEGTAYYAGALQGGASATWIAAMKEMAAMVDEDAANGVVPIHHDESVWNRYLIDHPPTVVLAPAYCCPESWPMPDRRLLALDKQHAAMRQP